MATWKSSALGLIKERSHSGLQKSPELKSVGIWEHIRKPYDCPVYPLPWVPAYDQCWRQALGLHWQTDWTSISVLTFQSHKYQESVCCSIKGEWCLYTSQLSFSHPSLPHQTWFFPVATWEWISYWVNYSKSWQTCRLLSPQQLFRHSIIYNPCNSPLLTCQTACSWLRKQVMAIVPLWLACITS